MNKSLSSLCPGCGLRVAARIARRLAPLVALALAPHAFAWRVLVFTHAPAIAAPCVTAVREIAVERGWQFVEETTDITAFTAANLARFDVIIWNDIPGEVLNAAQRTAFEEFIRNGGGFVGLGRAAAGPRTGEVPWPWFRDMLGAQWRPAAGTPALARLAPATLEHPSTDTLTTAWTLNDAWPEWSADPAATPAITVLLAATIEGHTRPLSWSREYRGGRVFYTALGRGEAIYRDASFRRHFGGGVKWAAMHSPNVTRLEIARDGLILDLDADKGLTLEEGDNVAAWENQVRGSSARSFVKRDEGRRQPGSGRPTLLRAVPALNAHDALRFAESELINMDADAFDRLITGDGYTWIVLLAPAVQIGRVQDVNVFLGNPRNGPFYEGILAGLDDGNTPWMSSRNGRTFGRYDANNPRVSGPRLQHGQFHLVAGRMAAGTGSVVVELFVDGAKPAGSAIFPVNPEANSSRLAIGQERDAIDHPGLESFDGDIARVLIYRRPLSGNELAATINALKLTYLHRAP
ncbi:MAG: hypothetical protein EXS37_13525 [Opitutus sp.]|nr:hypothetical protein [Opitutus sp.]